MVAHQELSRTPIGFSCLIALISTKVVRWETVNGAVLTLARRQAGRIKEGSLVIVIGRMTDDAARVQADRIVVETDDSVKAMDKLIIARRLAIAGRERQTSFHHLRASEDGLLAIPDAVAWCYAKGGSWRRRAESLIKEVITL